MGRRIPRLLVRVWRQEAFNPSRTFDEASSKPKEDQPHGEAQGTLCPDQSRVTILHGGLKDFRIPFDYGSSPLRCVRVSSKMVGLKSHNYYKLIQ